MYKGNATISPTLPSVLSRKDCLAQPNSRSAWPRERLISRAAFATSAEMTITRISELDRETTQLGKANTDCGPLEFEREEPLRPDPLTGWDGCGDTNPQVRMTFSRKEAAIAYCDENGLASHLVPAPVQLKLRACADSFH
jgi:hypothetical protein